MSIKETTRPGNVDQVELDRFAKLADEWWNPNGKFKPLHKLGPARLGFIRDAVSAHFALPATGLRPFKALTMLDIGCGGGLISEPLSRLGASVTGIEPAEANIGAARQHALESGLEINYRAATVQDLEANRELFDVVACLEVVEHVPDPGTFIKSCAAVVKPGGLLVLSTINRTAKSFLLAIVGAEYVLRWLPVGTHRWDRFITPGELDRHVRNAGLGPLDCGGLIYNPLADRWSVGSDTDVNYIGAAAKAATTTA